MKKWVRRLHLWLGLAVSLPVLAWSVSGFFLALPPGSVGGEPYAVIDPGRVNLTPSQVKIAVDRHLGKPSNLTSISLEQRGSKATYSAFGQEGAFLVDAESGEVGKPPPPPARVKWVRTAHFFNFAGQWRTALLLLFSLLSSLSTVSGLWLAWAYFRPQPKRS